MTSKDAFVHIIYIIGSVAGGLASSFRAASDQHKPQLTGRRVTNDLARYSTRIQLELWAARLLCSALCELMADSSSSSSDNFAENHLKVCKHFDNLPTFTSHFLCQRTVYEKKFSFVYLLTLLRSLFEIVYIFETYKLNIIRKKKVFQASNNMIS